MFAEVGYFDTLNQNKNVTNSPDKIIMTIYLNLNFYQTKTLIWVGGSVAKLVSALSIIIEDQDSNDIIF